MKNICFLHLGAPLPTLLPLSPFPSSSASGCGGAKCMQRARQLITKFWRRPGENNQIPTTILFLFLSATPQHLLRLLPTNYGLSAVLLIFMELDKPKSQNQQLTLHN